MVIIVDYPNGFSVITEVLKSRRGRQERVRERAVILEAEKPCDAGRGELLPEECSWALKAGKGKEMDSPQTPEKKERNTAGLVLI